MWFRGSSVSVCVWEDERSRVRGVSAGGDGGCQTGAVLHKVVWCVIRRVADTLEGATGRWLRVMGADEGACAIAVLGLVAPPEDECETEKSSEEGYSAYCAAGDGADVLF
jgi:hypothetical protein